MNPKAKVKEERFLNAHAAGLCNVMFKTRENLTTLFRDS
jgi:hypothetical protein